MTPAEFNRAFAAAIKAADARLPRFRTYEPGIGPHSEDEQVRLAAADLRCGANQINRGVPYPNAQRQKCDLQVVWHRENWFIEFKLFRPAGDNGKLNDQNLNHLLSPYDQDRSSLTDCRKLRASGFKGRKFVSVIVYDWPARPFDPARDAFEHLARAEGQLGERIEHPFEGLSHRHHRAGRIVTWEVL